MKKAVGTLFVTAVAVAGFGSSAQAASDITVGGSCKASANWTVNVSANFNNTSGSPSRGDVDYIVLSSPGTLDVGTDSLSSAVDYYGPGATSPSARTYGFTYVKHEDGRYFYRTDPPFGNVGKVTVNPRTSTGVFCNSYSSLVTLYSKN